MTISAKIIAHSVSNEGKEIVTFFVQVPRFIWAEVLTHRVFSRNASSSRAIPIARLSADILNDTAMPVFFGKNQSGMQAREELNVSVENPFTGEMMTREDAWRAAAADGVNWATAFSNAGYHKQLSNRLQENLGHIRAIITTTELDNFFELRCHEDAQPEIKALADAMCVAYTNSTPELIESGGWHLPYVGVADIEAAIEMLRGVPGDRPPSMAEINKILRKVSAARCARTSFKTFEGKISTIAEDMVLCDKLATVKPLHASPFEHAATPDRKVNTRRQIFIRGEWQPVSEGLDWLHPEDHRNFVGWRQSRAFVERGI